MLRTVPKLFNDKGPIQNLNTIRHDEQKLKKEVETTAQFKKMQREEIQHHEMLAIKGLKTIYYTNSFLILSNMFQIDLIKKNRWKDYEMVGTGKIQWIMVVINYLAIDTLLFFSAFIQAQKLFTYFDHQEHSEQTRRASEDSAINTRTSKKRSFIIQYF